jgi:hypothetical protein
MCDLYFSNNPYDTWFKKLDYILSGSRLSYYFPNGNACHLDLVPYATKAKWNELKVNEREYLIDKSRDILSLALRDSCISFLVLNGQAVVDNFEKATNVQFQKYYEPKWDLPRKSGKSVKGKAYIAIISKIGDIELDRDIKVIGYNHNIQSSYGINNIVIIENK